MKKLYSLTVRTLTFLIALTALNQGVVTAMQQHMISDTSKSKTVRVSDSRIGLRTLYSSSNKSGYIPFRPSYANTISGTKILQQVDPVNDLNVKIYPVPVADQINISYHLNKDSNVLIEIFDILGSKISTLFSRRVSAGEQKNSFPTNSKLVSGVYTITITAGTKHVSKRISVL